MPTITEFKNQMRAGGARSNQYEVRLNFPAFVNAGQAARTVSFLAKAAAIPAITVDDIQVMYRGRPVHFAGERQFAPWNITIINDGTYFVRNALERWSNGIAAMDNTTGLTNPADYQVQMSVLQLDRNNTPLKTYTFYDAWPSSLGAMALSFDDPKIQEFDCTFTYNYHQQNM